MKAKPILLLSFLFLSGVFFLSGGLPVGGSVPLGVTERVSLVQTESEVSASSGDPSISADGRYVTFHTSGALIPGDTNNNLDVYVIDRQTGQMSRASVSSNGSQAHGYYPSISASGRYVAFQSAANNLVPGDTNAHMDIFVHDLTADHTSRVSIASDGSQSNANSWDADVSADGCHTVFESDANNLVPNDENGFVDIFAHDCESGETIRVSVSSEGDEANNRSYAPSISDDGRYIAFSSDAGNLVQGDDNSHQDVFVHDLDTQETTRVSVASDGSQGNHHSSVRARHAISADGRYVTFSSIANNLVSGDTFGKGDVFVHDRQTGSTTRVSISSSGFQGNASSEDAAISSDGRYVSFKSQATTLTDPPANGVTHIYYHDRSTGETVQVSVDTDGSQANNISYHSSISGDGPIMAFDSTADNLVPDDDNKEMDVFVRSPNRVRFSGEPLRGIASLTVNFENLSAGEFDQCSWVFGDGGTASSCSDQSHTYKSPGIYDVTLTVSGSRGDDTVVKNNYITVFERAIADFTASPLTGIAPKTVSFTNLSSGDFNQCLWEFGDGGTSATCGNPSHTYSKSGTFTVSLTVQGAGGKNTKAWTAYITIYDPVKADFIASPLTGIAPKAVSFTNLSSGDFNQCLWEFGDGATSIDCDDQQHRYNNPGSYTISLTVSGPGGEDTIPRENYVNVYGELTAEFSASPLKGTPPLRVQFQNLSAGDFDECIWDFGDGSPTSKELNPTHDYLQEGSYTVSMSISGPWGDDAETKTNYIVVELYHNYIPIISGE